MVLREKDRIFRLQSTHFAFGRVLLLLDLGSLLEGTSLLPVNLLLFPFKEDFGRSEFLLYCLGVGTIVSHSFMVGSESLVNGLQRLMLSSQGIELRGYIGQSILQKEILITWHLVCCCLEKSNGVSSGNECHVQASHADGSPSSCDVTRARLSV